MEVPLPHRQAIINAARAQLTLPAQQTRQAKAVANLQLLRRPTERNAIRAARRKDHKTELIRITALINKQSIVGHDTVAGGGHGPIWFYQKTILKKWYISAPIAALTGIVSIQAQKIFVVTPHFTAVAPFLAPMPMIAPVMVWVVLTGIPK